MGKFSEYKLPLKTLAPGVHTMNFHLDKVFFANMENTDVHDADLNVELTIDYTGDRYSLTFVITGEVVLLCDRCLDDLHLPIDTTYHVTVEYGDDYDDSGDDTLIIPESDNYLNVAYMIYDTVVLAIPMKHVHPMGKCNRQMSAMLHKHRAGGTSVDDEDTQLAQDLVDEIDNIDESAEKTDTDPRWDALRSLQGSEGGENQD